MKQISVLVLENQLDLLTANTLYCLVSSEYLEVHIVSKSSNSPNRFLTGIKSLHYIPETETDVSFLAFIEQVVLKTNAEVLVATNLDGLNFLKKHERYLEKFVHIMPLPERSSFEIAADKGLLAAYMLKNGIPTPPTVFDFDENLEMELERLAFPVLLKPKVGDSGFAAVEDEPPITVFKDKVSLLSFIKEQGIADKYIVQQLVTGYVIGCNVLYRDGQLIAYTIQKSLTSTKPFAPSFGIEFIDSREVIAIVDALMSKLQWNGVANLDLIYDSQNQKLMVLEINPRFWLTIIGSMVRANINFPALACKQALHQPVEHANYRLGKYIPFSTYIKYRLTPSPSARVNFNWNEIDVAHFVKTLPVKAYIFYKEKFKKVSRMAYEVKPTVQEPIGL